MTEACLGGDLAVYVSRMKDAGIPMQENLARSLVSCIVSALGYLHSQQIIYRDLKPENLVVDQRGALKLVDFGLAKSSARGPAYTLCGTAEYLAPEMIMLQGHGLEVDWWALGVLVYELFHGRTPFVEVSLSDPALKEKIHFNGHVETQKRPAIKRHPVHVDLTPEEIAIYRRITHPDVKPLYDANLSKPLLSFIKRLLRRNPLTRLGGMPDGASSRSGCESVRAHEWLSPVEWSAGGQPLRLHPLPLPAVSGVVVEEASMFETANAPLPKSTVPWPLNFIPRRWEDFRRHISVSSVCETGVAVDTCLPNRGDLRLSPRGFTANSYSTVSSNERLVTYTAGWAGDGMEDSFLDMSHASSYHGDAHMKDATGGSYAFPACLVTSEESGLTFLHSAS